MTTKTSDTGVPASARRRVLAFVVDCVGVSILLTLTAGLLLTVTPPQTGSADPVSVWHGVVTSTVGVLYFAASWRTMGATPAQQVLGLQVRPERSEARMSLSRGVVRWAALGGPLWIGVVLVPGVLGLGAMMLSALWAAMLLASVVRSGSGRGIHDRITQTQVVRTGVRAPA